MGCKVVAEGIMIPGARGLRLTGRRLWLSSASVPETQKLFLCSQSEVCHW